MGLVLGMTFFHLPLWVATGNSCFYNILSQYKIVNMPLLNTSFNLKLQYVAAHYRQRLYLNEEHPEPVDLAMVD